MGTGQSEAQGQRQPDEIPADQAPATRSPTQRRRPGQQQPIHAVPDTVLAGLPDTGNRAATQRSDAAGFWDLWDELSRRLMWFWRLRYTALPVHEPRLGVIGPRAWVEYFRQYDEFNVPIPGEHWGHWSTKLLQAFREQRA